MDADKLIVCMEEDFHEHRNALDVVNFERLSDLADDDHLVIPTGKKFWDSLGTGMQELAAKKRWRFARGSYHPPLILFEEKPPSESEGKGWRTGTQVLGAANRPTPGDFTVTSQYRAGFHVSTEIPAGEFSEDQRLVFIKYYGPSFGLKYVGAMHIRAVQDVAKGYAGISEVMKTKYGMPLPEKVDYFRLLGTDKVELIDMTIPPPPPPVAAPPPPPEIPMPMPMAPAGFMCPGVPKAPEPPSPPGEPDIAMIKAAMAAAAAAQAGIPLPGAPPVAVTEAIPEPTPPAPPFPPVMRPEHGEIIVIQASDTAAEFSFAEKFTIFPRFAPPPPPVKAPPTFAEILLEDAEAGFTGVDVRFIGGPAESQYNLTAHRSALSTVEYFRRLFTVGIKEGQPPPAAGDDGFHVITTPPFVDESTMRNFIRWIYTRRVPKAVQMDVPGCLNLIRLGNYCVCESLVHDCVQAIDRLKSFEVNSALDALEIANVLTEEDATPLRRKAMQYVVAHFDEVASCERFHKLVGTSTYYAIIAAVYQTLVSGVFIMLKWLLNKARKNDTGRTGVSKLGFLRGGTMVV